MATKKISVNPKHRKDPAQRYVMPVFVLRYQGRNQNTKTSLENLEAISAAIRRPASCIWKYFGLTFNTRLDKSEEAGVFFLRGTYKEKQLQDQLDKFINAFVICGECGNPETKLRLSKEKGKIYRDCGACGSRTDVRGDRKMLNVLVKYGAVSAEEAEDKPKKRKKKRKKKTTSGGDEGDDEVSWSATLTKEAKEKRRAELLGKTGKQDLIALIKEKKFDSAKPFSDCQSKEGWSDRKFGSFIFTVSPSEKIVPAIKSLTPVLKALAPKKKDFQFGLLDGLGVTCLETFPHLAASFNGILQALYTTEVISEDNFTAWYEEKSTMNADAKKAGEKFFDWLCASSEEESEED